MRQLLRLRSFWCCALVLLLLGGLWVSSRIAPHELNVRKGSETVHLKNLEGAFEVEREIPHMLWGATPRWTVGPLTPAPQAAYFPRPAWTDWHEKDLTTSVGEAFNVGSTSIEAWKVLIGSKQMMVSLPHWLAMLAWLLLCLPLLVWRWRAAKRRAMDGSQAAA